MISQEILWSLLFSLLCMRPGNIIIQFLDIFVLSLWFCLLFFYLKRLYWILICRFKNISLTILVLLTKWIICCSSFFMMLVSIGIQYSSYIYAVSNMYDSSSLRRLVGPTIFLNNLRLITSLSLFPVSFLTSTNPHLFFRELHFSDSKSTIRIYHIVVFVT